MERIARREGEEDVEDVEEEDNNNNYDINNIGQTIDSHDVVFRVNQGPVGGRYEEKVGAKTDFRVLNNGWAEKYGQESALGEKLREAVETDETVISTRASAERFYALAKQFRRHKRGVELHPPWMASDRVQSDVRKLLEKVRAVKTRIIVMRENESAGGSRERTRGQKARHHARRNDAEYGDISYLPRARLWMRYRRPVRIQFRTRWTVFGR